MPYRRTWSGSATRRLVQVTKRLYPPQESPRAEPRTAGDIIGSDVGFLQQSAPRGASLTDTPQHQPGQDAGSVDEAKKFRALLQHANDLVYSVTINPDAGTWRLEFLSDRILDLSGCRPDEFLQEGRLGEGGPFRLAEPAEHPFELLHPDDLEQALQATRRLSAGEKVIREYRIRNRQSEEYRWVEDRSEPEMDSHHRVVRIWGIVRDITERREREDALRHLAAIVEVTDDAVVGLDPAGRVVTWNSAASALYGYESEEIVGELFFDRVVPDRAVSLNDQLKSLESGHFKEPDTEHVNRVGQAVPVSLTASVIDGANTTSRMIALVVRDLTERQQLEQQLLQSQKMEAVGRLAGGIAHDFNNILTVILGLAREIRLGSDDPLAEEVEGIQHAAERAALLTRQLLAFSRRQMLQPKVLDPNELITNLVGLVRKLLGEHIEVATELDASTGRIKADPVQLEQVVMNLAANAPDAMPDGGRVTIETANVDFDDEFVRTHSGSRPGAYVRLRFADTGAGMSDETLVHVFEPFFTTKGPALGTGLGLSMVYGVVKQSLGYISVVTEPGEGTAFEIYLPRVREVSPAPADPPTTALGVETILLAEDEPSLRGFVRRALEAAGYRVLEAHDGKDALTAFEENAEDIQAILTDIVMPNQSGPQLADRVRARRPGIGIVYMSGYPDLADDQRPTLDETSVFIQKPFTMEELTVALRNVLDRSSAEA